MEINTFNSFSDFAKKQLEFLNKFQSPENLRKQIEQCLLPIKSEIEKEGGKVEIIEKPFDNGNFNISVSLSGFSNELKDKILKLLSANQIVL